MIVSRVGLAVALGATVFTITGCGGAPGPGVTQVKLTVERALAALADGNGPAFCALATAGAQAELARTTPGAGCASVVDRISRQLSPQVKLALRHARVSTVTVSGDRASIRDGAITSTRGSLASFLRASGAPTRLTREPDGTWRISG